MSRLLVRLTIPITERSDNTGAPLMFYCWLPTGQENGIHYNRASYHLLLWFDATCAISVGNITEDEIARMPAVTAHKIHADVIIDGLDEPLLQYMQSRDYTRLPTSEEEPLAQRYEDHGREVFSLIQDGLNGLLTYARTEKGQYWIRPYKIDLENTASHSVEFSAQACINDGPWFRWQPSQAYRGGPIVLYFTQDPHFLTPEDWPRVQEFIARQERPNLMRQLLAGAEFLADSGHDRAALTEAISALEVALARFARSPRADALIPTSLRKRLGVESLPNLVDRLGLSASVAFLLPILLPEEELPADLLAYSRNAITERQNIVHQGQRQVDPDRLKQFLNAVRTLCETLLRWTAT